MVVLLVIPRAMYSILTPLMQITYRICTIDITSNGTG